MVDRVRREQWKMFQVGWLGVGAIKEFLLKQLKRGG